MRGISEPDTRYTPTRILVNSIMNTTNQGGGGPIHDFSPGLGLLVMTIYAAIALAAGAVVFMKRDA
jgi:ABC-type transport system involved in multi-copper enzyme maturation permease subunit